MIDGGFHFTERYSLHGVTPLKTVIRENIFGAHIFVKNMYMVHRVHNKFAKCKLLEEKKRKALVLGQVAQYPPMQQILTFLLASPSEYTPSPKSKRYRSQRGAASTVCAKAHCVSAATADPRHHLPAPRTGAAGNAQPSPR